MTSTLRTPTPSAEETDTVAAVIPTSGRPSVVAAVQSVLSQTRPADDVVVVTARQNEAAVRSLLREYLAFIEIEVTEQSPPTGGLLRYLGTRSTRCNWYAFLDDDDEWLPDKLELQVHYARSRSLDVAASGLYFRSPNTVGEKPVPARPYKEGQPVADYLFAGRSLRADRPLLHTSTLLVSQEAIDVVNWDASLSVHQDWDLVIRLDDAGFRIGQSAEPLTYVMTGSSGSMSATNKWVASLDWWTKSRSVMSNAASTDFLYSQVLRYVIRERSLRGLGLVFRSALGSSRPSLSAVAIALTGLAPRWLFERAMLRDAGARSAAEVAA